MVTAKMPELLDLEMRGIDRQRHHMELRHRRQISQHAGWHGRKQIGLLDDLWYHQKVRNAQRNAPRDAALGQVALDQCRGRRVPRDPAVTRSCGFDQHVRLLRELRQRQRVTHAWVPGAHQAGITVLKQMLLVKAGVEGGQKTDRQVHLTRNKGLLIGLARQLQHAQIDVRGHLAEFGHQAWEVDQFTQIAHEYLEGAIACGLVKRRGAVERALKQA